MSEVQLSPPAASNGSSLLSLSIAASNVTPLTPPSSEATVTVSKPSSQGAGSNGYTKHRRLSSAGRSRRRLSDARDAATRPSLASLQNTSTSLAALSLSSPTLSQRPLIAPAVNGTPQQSLPIMNPTPISADDISGSVDDKTLAQGGNGNMTRTGRKRGTTFTCESCSKVYRHPSCLIKHRWEHTPQWREASKFVLSKHQQVQLLEAAAILSHLSPSSASLPEDRSLWPSFLSGGLVPLPAYSTSYTTADLLSTDGNTLPSSIPTSYPISSSVPATTIMTAIAGRKRSGSMGPRLHDYAIPQASVSGPGGITQVRPGLLGVSTVTPSTSDTQSIPSSTSNSTSPPGPFSPTTSTSDPTVPVSADTKNTSRPAPVPIHTSDPSAAHDDALNLLALRTASVRSGDSSWGSPKSYDASFSPYSPSPFTFGGPCAFAGQRGSTSQGQAFHGHRNGHTKSKSFSGTSWSLPRSSVRSKSSPSESPPPSEGKSEDEEGDGDGDADIPVDVDVDIVIHGSGDDPGGPGAGFGRVRVAGVRSRYSPFGYGAMKTGSFGGCKTEDAEIPGFSVREEEEEGGHERQGEEKITSVRSKVPKKTEEWDGMEMEMEMD